MGHRGGGIVYHRHDEKELNWEPGGVRSGAGVRRSGVSQESSGSSETWEAAFCLLRLRRQLSPFISRIWTWWVRRSSRAPVRRSEPNTSVHSSKGRLVVTRMEPRS